MNKPLLVLFALILVSLQGEPLYEVSFTGEGLAPIQYISLSADNSALYLAYMPPDSPDTVVTVLSPELVEVTSMRREEFKSPYIRAYNDRVYLAGIENENIIVEVYTTSLEFVRDFQITVEEPTCVCVYPYEEGFLLAYAHRFLEDNLLHQDVFIKKVDSSFNVTAEGRLTYWDYWEDPSLAVYDGRIFASYANAPLYGFLDRHVVVTELNDNLEEVTKIRYPKDATEELNVVSPELAVLNDALILLYRVTDRTFFFTRYTWEGQIIVIPGNVRAVELTGDLMVEKEIFITQDYKEEYEPAAVSAFGKVYFAYSFNEENVMKLQVISAGSVEGLEMEKGEPPPQIPYTVIAGVILVIFFVVLFSLIVGFPKLRRKSKKKKEKPKKK